MTPMQQGHVLGPHMVGDGHPFHVHSVQGGGLAELQLLQ